jgi:hypothetical protein
MQSCDGRKDSSLPLWKYSDVRSEPEAALNLALEKRNAAD